MSRYTVQITFKVPGLRGPVERTLPGRGTSLRLYGSQGMLAVTGSVHEESPAEAATAAARAVAGHWSKSEGALQLVAWTAHRERVLAFGARRTGASGRNLMWDDGTDPGDEGGAGVREPRRPNPGPGSLSAEAELPQDYAARRG